MEEYDAAVAPDPAAWIELDEDEQLGLVSDYHQRMGDALPNVRLHASMHVIIENQLAMGVPGVGEALERLQHEGLDRHDAIHAVGSVMLAHMTDMLSVAAAWDDERSRRYAEELRRLTAEEWLQSWEG